MNPGIAVRSVRALVEWKSALKRFTDRTWGALRRTDQEIIRAEEWLQSGVRYWRRMVQNCRQEVDDATEALDSCQEDSDRDCGRQEDALDRAKSRLHRSEEGLANQLQWMGAVSNAANEYRTQAERLKGYLATDVPRGDALIGRAISNLEKFLAVDIPGDRTSLARGAIGLQQEDSPEPSARPWNVSGDSPEYEKLKDALNALRNSGSGKNIGDAIRNRRTWVRFGTLPTGTAGKYDPSTNVLLVSKRLMGSSSEVISAWLAHEGVHVQFGNSAPSIHEEYQAFKALVDVWTEIKGTKTDEHLDGLTKRMKLPKVEVMTLIKKQPPYADLPYYV